MILSGFFVFATFVFMSRVSDFDMYKIWIGAGDICLSDFFETGDEDDDDGEDDSPDSPDDLCRLTENFTAGGAKFSAVTASYLKEV